MVTTTESSIGIVPVISTLEPSIQTLIFSFGLVFFSIIAFPIFLVLAPLVTGIFVGSGGAAEGTAEEHFDQGKKLVDQGRYDEAIEEYTQSIDLDPNLAMAYYKRGTVYGNLGQDERTLADYDEAIRLDPQKASAYYNRGDAYAMKGDFDRAMADFDKAIELDPQSVLAYGHRGLAYKVQGKKAEAIADFEKFITLTNNPKLIEMARQQIEELSK